MIKQVNIIFKLGGLEVYSITTVAGRPHGSEPIIDDFPTITEDYWWADKNNVKGFGPFPTISAAVKAYEAHYTPQLKPREYDTEVIGVDFKAKKRQEYDEDTKA